MKIITGIGVLQYTFARMICVCCEETGIVDDHTLLCTTCNASVTIDPRVVNCESCGGEVMALCLYKELLSLGASAPQISSVFRNSVCADCRGAFCGYCSSVDKSTHLVRCPFCTHDGGCKEILFGVNGEYEWLSNHSPHITRCIDGTGVIAKTVTHAYHLSKFPGPAAESLRARIMNADTPEKAASIGRNRENARFMNPCHDKLRLAIMEELLRWKITYDSVFFRRALADTHRRPLVYRGDRFWGMDDRGVGENHLGRIWEKLRSELIFERKRL